MESYRLIALARKCLHMRVRYTDPPAIGIHTRDGAARQVRILTQENGGDDIIMEIQVAANDAADNGVQMYWHIGVIQPAMPPWNWSRDSAGSDRI